MFQFPESRLSEAIYSLQDTWSLLQVGSPDSDIDGSLHAYC